MTFPSNEIETKLSNGLSILIDIRDYRVIEILLTGICEPIVTDVFRKLIKSGDVVFDVGANIGYFSLVASCLVGKEGLCYAFDPLEFNIGNISKSIEINDITNVRVIHKFVGDGISEQVTMSLPSPYNLGTGSIVVRDREKTTKVNTITLDAFSRNEKIDKIDFVKMDIEGAEYLAIQGMREGIKNLNYNYAAIEFHEYHLNRLHFSSMELKKIFVEAGYRAYEIMPPSYLIDRTENRLQGSYMLFMAPGTDYYGEEIVDVSVV